MSRTHAATAAEGLFASGGLDGGPSAPALRTDSLAAGVLMLLVLSVVQRVAGFVRAVLFCRWLDPQDLGLWDMAWGFLMLAAPLAVLSLPGTFGRYVEYFRQRGQFRTFLRRTVALCAALAAVSAAVLCLSPHWFSQLIFGTPEQLRLVALLAGSLLAVILYNYLLSLYMALRNIRLVSALEFCNSLSFAVLGIGLLWYWECSAASVVIAYGGACLLSAALSCPWLRQAWQAMPETLAPQPRAAFWSKLLPFAGWVLLSNLLTNLFAVADRYVIVHFAPGSPAEALTLVGQYHSSRVVPLLLASLAAILGTVLLPHLSHDWEAGRRARVSARLNLFLKLLVLLLTAASAGILLLAPLLFDVAFQGKYADGLAVLPWTLVYCIWCGAGMVAQSYLWCAERAGWSSVALSAGLAVGVALNVLWLPAMGLHGTVLATSAANLVVLVLVLWLGHRAGMRRDRGLWLVLAAPLALCLGPWVAAMVLAAVVWEAVCCDRLFSRAEKQRLVDILRKRLQRLST
jgi:O-antigen/teichoic acid export membrane protein